jgi:hypothetical protein
LVNKVFWILSGVDLNECIVKDKKKFSSIFRQSCHKIRERLIKI